MSKKAVDFREIDYSKKTVILFGEEKLGLSNDILEKSHKHIIIPMYGMAQSLNVSAAAAIVLYEAQRQRQLKNLYSPKNQYTLSEKNKILFEHGHQVYAKICQEKNIPYPNLDQDGQIDAPQSWYDLLKYKL